MEILWQDLRYGFRTLWRSRGFALIAILALALGIGANSAIFSVVNGVLLRPLPYPQPERLFIVWEKGRQLDEMSIAYPNYSDWRAQNQSLENLAIFRRESFNLTGNNEPEQLTGAQVSANLFATVGVKPIMGRDFLPEEDTPAGNPVTILSYGLWQRRFGADTKIIGKNLSLNGKDFTVIGVMPPRFSYPSRMELWVPIAPYSTNPNWTDRGNHPGIYGVARIKQGVSVEQANTELDTIAMRLEQTYPKSNSGNRVVLTPLLGYLVKEIKPALLLLLGAVGFLLLIACANVANLLLARATARQREIAVRAALGASRWRIIRQLLTESVMMALCGGGLGLVMAMWGTDLIISMVPEDMPRIHDVSVDGRVLAFMVAVSILTGIIFGLMPAIHASKPDLNEALKDGGRAGAASPRGHRIRSGLVISEVALALVLLIGAGLLIKSFARLRAVNPGFNADNLLTFSVALPVAKYPEDPQRLIFYRQLLARLSALPGVSSVGVTSDLPFISGSQTSFNISGRPLLERNDRPLADYQNVNGDYFPAMGMTLLRGRAFNDQDVKDSARSVIIDEGFARRYWPNEDPIGKQLFEGEKDLPENRFTIVGVVNSIKLESLNSEPTRCQLYFSYTMFPQRRSSLLVRASGDLAGLAAAIKHVVQEIDKDQPIYDLQTMNQILADSIAPQRLAAMLLTVFAALALLLAIVGIYGVMAYSVTQRTHEIGVRMALGAQTGDVLKMVIKQGMMLVSIGVAIGLAAAFALVRAMSSLLYGVSASDPSTYLTIAALLILVAMLANYIPARRAAKVDPMIALRCE
jgi:putative ABC transport system permease protein